MLGKSKAVKCSLVKLVLIIQASLLPLSWRNNCTTWRCANYRCWRWLARLWRHKKERKRTEHFSGPSSTISATERWHSEIIAPQSCTLYAMWCSCYISVYSCQHLLISILISSLIASPSLNFPVEIVGMPVRDWCTMECWHRIWLCYESPPTIM